MVSRLKQHIGIEFARRQYLSRRYRMFVNFILTIGSIRTMPDSNEPKLRTDMPAC